MPMPDLALRRHLNVLLRYGMLQQVAPETGQSSPTPGRKPRRT